MQQSSTSRIDAVAASDITFRGVTLQEAIDILENDNIDADSIFIEPPDPNVNSDEDSAEEDEGGYVDNLCGAQLRSLAEIKRTKHKSTLSSDEDEEKDCISEKSKIRKKKSYSWDSCDITSQKQIFPEPNFTKYTGKTPIELFELFIDDEIVTHIIEQSTLYAQEKSNKNPQFSKEEMRVFLAILFLSGYVNVPSKRSFWENAEDVRNSLASNAMRRSRFLEINQFIHFENNANINKTDKFWKIRPLVTKIQKRIRDCFVAEEQLSYDESMIEYFGKHSCKQCIRNKPIRFGYKSWSLNTPSGYLRDFELYQGKGPNQNEYYEANFGRAAAPLVVMLDRFSHDISNLPFELYFDNLFTSIPLLEHLQKRGYRATGTFRENRVPKNCPLTPSKSFKKQNRGSYENQSVAGISLIIVRWVDNNVITVASTGHGIHPIQKAGRYSKVLKKKVLVDQPYLISQYNKYMGGTDRMDENISYYRIGFRGKKWYWPLFTWLLDVCMQNAWVLGRKSGITLSQLEFRRYIVQIYLTKYRKLPLGLGRPSTSKSSSIQCSVTDEIRLDGIGHLVQQCARRRCQGFFCNSTVRTECSKCNVGLCIPCFIKFHSN